MRKKLTVLSLMFHDPVTINNHLEIDDIICNDNISIKINIFISRGRLYGDIVNQIHGSLRSQVDSRELRGSSREYRIFIISNY